MRLIPTRVHAVLDYAMGVLLIAAPWLFMFYTGGAETWVPVVLGVGVILYSLCTAYELGAVPAISMRTHLGLDAGGGLLLAVSPWLFGFAGIVWVPHLILGLLELGAALMTETTPAHIPHRAGGTRVTGAR
ncbi:MAG: hypothetical protein KY476_05925 [Planctomycetes bacterium]|nr:hypothetical protein [Planctomycetota bacterium]